MPATQKELLLDAPVCPRKTPDFLDWVIGSLIVAGLFIMVHASLAGGLFTALALIWQGKYRFPVILRPSFLWAIMGSLFIVFRTILWFHYRSYPKAKFADAPSLTVIIPAFNEGPMVKKSVQSVMSANYPRKKLEVLVIDDGSQDSTWSHIQEAASENPDQVRTIRFPFNRGKREALVEGFRLARGEVVVTIDSDSIISPDTLLAMVGPFSDPKVGAVAGKVKAYNRNEGIIPRMLHIRYILSFDFLRAVQSTYGTVYCCPGALAAYRIKAVREVLDQWQNQTFLGVRCTYGEDRALTNYILSQGYDTVYQGSAEVYTVVPDSYKKLYRMYLRWERSYIRETVHFSKILWKRPLWPRMISFFDLIITNLRYPVGWTAFGMLIYISISDPFRLIFIATAIGVFSFLNALYYLYCERRWDFLYGVLYSYFAFLALFWVFPYALLTVRSRSWMTR
ncbi:MAG TPA: glycosyltransferase [Thermodesulfobacteriota bacterium]|nr:glycosyltransferase [Thermodesulfobacteriota bacterium]